ncbi:hypothetical protein HYFRA_00010291 [Hymenoscyphus fraxineus]|uniref:Uncharacterized protein n=1 Tax=Hymenoscyphus fraxineus TaxID=746836 RepID=A0A9N9KYK6_9HELO|nr:hypothetical protein HYFRA_00010291 [Hymenoscyphus fraxineus]
MTFRFALTMNELGIKYANMWGAITAAGHLYSAMQHTTPNLPRWHDLDTLLQIHTTPYFFWDDIPPSTPSGFASSYEKASNISKSIADRQDRASSTMVSRTNMISTPGGYLPANKNEFGIGIASKVSALYHERFCFEQPTPVRNLPLVEHILSHTASTEINQTLTGVQKILKDANAFPKTPFTTTPSAREVSTKDLTTQFENHQMLTETQLLSALCTRLQQEAYTLNFDYFTFHIRCMRFLKAVYEEFRVEIIEEDGELIEGRGELNMVVHRIFTWLMDQEKVENVKERLRGVLEMFVEREGRAEIDSLKEYMDGLILAN